MGSTIPQLKRLWAVLPCHRYGAVAGGAGLMLLSSALEGLSAAAVLPLLLGLMGDGATGLGREAAIGVFCGLVLASGLVRWFNLALNGQLAAAVGSDLAERALAGVFALPFAKLRDLPGSQVVAALAPQLRQLIQFILVPVLQLVSAAALLVGLMVVLLLLAWPVVWPTLALMGLVYGLINWQVRPRLALNGRRVVTAQQEAIRLVQQSLGGLREMRLQGMDGPRLERFSRLDRPMRRLEAENAALAGMPRFVLEPVAMAAIALVGGGLLYQGVTPESFLPRLGVLAYGAQRLLPVGQQLWVSWSSIVAGAPLLEPLLPLLEQPLAPGPEPGMEPLVWSGVLAVRDVSFSFPSQPDAVIEGFHLELRPGEWLGLQGPSGCGKSTALDLLMGLLTPAVGSLAMDGGVLLPGSERLRAWQRRVTYAGARPPLLASRVREAVMIDQEHHGHLLEQVLRVTGLDDLALRLMGEQGQSLSAGQLQRLGLARALLSDPLLLVLDEATNALDPEAEAQVLGDLRRWRPELMVVMVSHREESFVLCDRVVRLG